MNRKEQNYSAALYIRLSKEDGDKEESESVTNQRKILKAFAKENNYIVFDEYVDDGYSGTNYERPNFKRMLRDIESKKVNMVITKNLARLGRDYIETGRYIETYFPEHNIRYIAVLDDVDTYLDKNSEIIPFKNVMNDYYAKETSKNIKKTKYKKAAEGFYYTTYAPFGYKKIDERGNIIIVEVQAQIVRRIFKEFISGKGTYQIAKSLNNEKIPGPAFQIEMHSKRYNKENLWDHNGIRRILTNKVYIGSIVQHKKRKISYKSKKEIRVPKEEQLVTDNHHEPIIDIETWNLVQKILETHRESKIKENEQLLKPFIYCGDCFCKMYVIKGGEKYKGVWNYRYHLCCSSSRKKKYNKCPNTYINYDKFEKIVLEEIYNLLKNYLKEKKFNNELALKNYHSKQCQNDVNKIENKIIKIEKEIDEIDRKTKVLYNDRLNEIIDLDDYKIFYDNLSKQKEILTNNLLETKNSLKNVQDEENEKSIDNTIKKQIKKIIMSKNLSKEDLYILIKKIEIDHNKSINIIFNFKELNVVENNGDIYEVI